VWASGSGFISDSGGGGGRPAERIRRRKLGERVGRIKLKLKQELTSDQ